MGNIYVSEVYLDIKIKALENCKIKVGLTLNDQEALFLFKQAKRMYKLDLILRTIKEHATTMEEVHEYLKDGE